MVVLKIPEELERGSILVSGVEEDDFVPLRAVIPLILVEKVACPEVWVDIAQPVQENIRTDLLVNLAYMFHYPVVDIQHEVIAVGLEQEGLCHIIWPALILLKHILEI